MTSRPEVTGRRVAGGTGVLPAAQAESDDAPLPADWIATPFRRWCKLAGISFSHGYALAAEGRLHLTKAGNRTLVTRAESDRFLKLTQAA